jgi:AraC family transcriptional regulator of adaptative response/methylated-DNA-[protein]-cysteine methyltransferase
VYCRPTCASRRPNRENVEFFDAPDAAEASGYRACKRCRPDTDAPSSGERSVERASAYLDAHLDETVTLERLAGVAHMSAFHLQRMFKRHVGLTPRQYVEARRAERLRARLREGDTVSRASFEAGYSSPSRVYEQATAHMGMTPGAYRKGGRGVRIGYAVAATPLGFVLVAATGRGVCAIALGDDEETLVAALREEHPEAAIERTADDLAEWVDAAVGAVTAGDARRLDVPLDVEATPFQWRVWRALQEIPRGETRTYAEIAAQIGSPGAARAVGRACAANRAALAIPCHRVVRADGADGGYRWGSERKRRILALESGRGELA